MYSTNKWIFIFLIILISGCQSASRSNQTVNSHGFLLFKRPKPTMVETIDIESVNRGKKIYDFNCAMCHGDSGKGDGPLVKAANSKAKNLTLLSKSLDENYIALKISEGQNTMPQWKHKLTVRQLKDVTHFIRSISSQN